jgi:hypothetical protein
MTTTARELGKAMAKVIPRVAVIAIALSGCGYEGQVNMLATIVRWLQLGHSNDYWLEMKNQFGDWEWLALVFGYWDDYEGCQELIAVYVAECPIQTMTTSLI